MMATIGLISLGCPRNLVDSEIMLGLLEKNGFKITEDFSRCDAAVINTCSFIEDAKKESIDLILRLVELKKENKIKSIIVTGCLPQRYPSELKRELKEIDAFLGTGDFIKIPEIVRKTLRGKKILEVSKTPSFLSDHTYSRSLITPKHFIYLKVAEGCNNHCSYCVIPAIRGSLRSRRIDSLLKETGALLEKHKLSEINLIGQDITLYGADLYGRPKLSGLIRKLTGLKAANPVRHCSADLYRDGVSNGARPVRHCSADVDTDGVSNGARWIRLLYTHPAHYTDELISVVKNEPAVCKYLDLPLQHINDRILKLMNRNVRKRDIVTLINRLRSEIPDVAIRTTFIVGFPGETDKEFNELVGFIKETRFERLGVFEYSREEGTPAYGFNNQIPDKVKKERFDVIMKLQQEISKEINSKFIGKELEVLIDEPEESKFPLPNGENDTQLFPLPNGERVRVRGDLHKYIGRTEYDAPEVDGNCFIRTKKLHKPGDFVRVKIVDTLEYDLVGEEV